MRANRRTSSSMASGTSARKASGRPPGGTTPRASRYSPASSAAIQRSSPPTRTRTARRSSSSRAQPRGRLGRRLRALRRLRRREVADAPQHVVQRVGVARPQALGAVLQVVLDLLERAGVDEVAQLLLPEQLAQQVAVEGQSATARRSAAGVSPSYM